MTLRPRPLTLDLRWTPHPVIVTIRHNRDYIRVLLYSYYTTTTGWRVLLTQTGVLQHMPVVPVCGALNPIPSAVEGTGVTTGCWVHLQENLKFIKQRRIKWKRRWKQRLCCFGVGYWPRPVTAAKSSVVVNALLSRVLKYGKKWRQCHSLCGIGIALY